LNVDPARLRGAGHLNEILLEHDGCAPFACAANRDAVTLEHAAAQPARPRFSKPSSLLPQAGAELAE
jgi:hypothetical protein